MRRGDIVTVSLRGEWGKPRPALVMQDERFAALLSVTVLPITSSLRDAPLLRVLIEPDARNGLTSPSQVMIDKIQTPPLTRVGAVIGRLDDGTMLAAARALAVFLGFG